MAARKLDYELLKKDLLILYRDHHDVHSLSADPLGTVNRKLLAADFEIVSFISAGLSYGRVEQIKKSLDKLWKAFEGIGLGEGGSGLRDWIVNNSGKTLKKEIQSSLNSWKHRFNNVEDIKNLCITFKNVFEEYESLADLYAQQKNLGPTELLENFSTQLRNFSDKKSEKSLSWFSCRPSEASTCKRMVMWLRWMLRTDEIDPGLWTRREVAFDKNFKMGAHLAFIPVDTHVFRWATENKLLNRKSPNWKCVEEITAFLREVEPSDPAKFDFCICHAGMKKFRSQ